MEIATERREEEEKKKTKQKTKHLRAVTKTTVDNVGGEAAEVTEEALLLRDAGCQAQLRCSGTRLP